MARWPKDGLNSRGERVGLGLENSATAALDFLGPVGQAMEELTHLFTHLGFGLGTPTARRSPLVVPHVGRRCTSGSTVVSRAAGSQLPYYPLVVRVHDGRLVLGFASVHANSDAGHRCSSLREGAMSAREHPRPATTLRSGLADRAAPHSGIRGHGRELLFNGQRVLATPARKHPLSATFSVGGVGIFGCRHRDL